MSNYVFNKAIGTQADCKPGPGIPWNYKKLPYHSIPDLSWNWICSGVYTENTETCLGKQTKRLLPMFLSANKSCFLAKIPRCSSMISYCIVQYDAVAYKGHTDVVSRHMADVIKPPWCNSSLRISRQYVIGLLALRNTIHSYECTWFFLKLWQMGLVVGDVWVSA